MAKNRTRHHYWARLDRINRAKRDREQRRAKPYQDLVERRERLRKKYPGKWAPVYSSSDEEEEKKAPVIVKKETQQAKKTEKEPSVDTEPVNKMEKLPLLPGAKVKKLKPALKNSPAWKLPSGETKAMNGTDELPLSAPKIGVPKPILEHQVESSSSLYAPLAGRHEEPEFFSYNDIYGLNGSTYREPFENSYPMEDSPVPPPAKPAAKEGLNKEFGGPLADKTNRAGLPPDTPIIKPWGLSRKEQVGQVNRRVPKGPLRDILLDRPKKR
ncbi:hypothetical protein P154DRAFT_574628 [Amniculicola lignicola CBS 123094]|uniref:Uncharacterized protein n=1 Tax=Amniculicola lignicola CBS 123094 TaxID=1392246 RepID=A0A6A5WMG1_9PLEO|nr:hypothetical protein P154DRAFT_574628 [Amniculicola lignicola CBS 123094]